jgi:hypothetical protein
MDMKLVTTLAQSAKRSGRSWQVEMTYHEVREHLGVETKLPIRQTASVDKVQPTFSAALALARRQVWQQQCFRMTAAHTDSPKLFA